MRLEQAQSLLAREGAVDVVIDVEEAGRVTLKSGTELGQAEGSAVGCRFFVFSGGVLWTDWVGTFSTSLETSETCSEEQKPSRCLPP